MRGTAGHLFVDGSASPSLSLPLGPMGEFPTPNQVGFGDGTGWLGGEAEFTAVSCSSIPEPATMGLLVVGALGVIRRRRA